MLSIKFIIIRAKTWRQSFEFPKLLTQPKDTNKIYINVQSLPEVSKQGES